MKKVPRFKTDDYTRTSAEARRQFVVEETGATLDHIGKYSIDPPTLSGNIENFTGVAQVPIGIAGPVLVHGEHAEGAFYVPMATTEGTLVASYSRGMKLTALAGGITTTVLDDAMQRAPVFVFENARYARAFGKFVDEHMTEIADAAHATSSFGRLRNIEQYGIGKMRWLRFNFTTGDAAGQNMVSRATRAACMWMLDQQLEGIQHFTLAANLDTDKKHSALNSLNSRGKRVVAEITIPKTILEEHFRTSSHAMHYQRQLSNMGAIQCGSINNGSHFANALTAMFIAMGQDVANIAESSAGFVYGEIMPDESYYFSVTIPSLIIASYGGGTALATQRECLEMIGCYGTGKVLKLAEIMAAVVLCGELSLSAAVIADEWVSSHEELGRNR